MDICNKGTPKEYWLPETLRDPRAWFAEVGIQVYTDVKEARDILTFVGQGIEQQC